MRVLCYTIRLCLEYPQDGENAKMRQEIRDGD